ncbi:alpha/beta fold hydrolase [Lapillicoccus sp.]|uniref:alpha/beta hydrolase n=1 Tax=Lapillicoccus sp. TaxID=1909287 RepID=UPI003265CB9A
MRRLSSVVAAAGLLAGSVAGGLALAPSAQATATVAAQPAAPAYTPPPIAWGACTNPTLVRFGAECGMVTVPLDYAKPGGTKIKLAVSRLKHTTPDSQYQGITLVNPGGPGGSGIIYSIFRDIVPNGGGQSYDWIGFDPRGVGSSQPSLTCDGNYFGYDRPYYVPVYPSVEQIWRNKTARYAADCAKAGGGLLDHMKTTDSVADMESIRAALGEKKINYLGFSYGTYLGQVYATLHPDRVRRFVFDSNVDARKVWYQANLDQDVAFDANIGIYFDWIAKYDSVYHLGNDGAAIEKTYYRVLNQLRANPQAGGLIGPDEWTDAFLGAGYYVYGWESTAEAFSKAVNQGDFSAIKDLYDSANGVQGPGADNGYAVYNAVQCTDTSWPKAWQKWKVDNWTIYGQHPFETWSNAWYNAPCITWAGKSGTPVTVDGSKAPPILLIDETHDAATPYAGSLYTRRIFPKSVLIEGVGGTTHAGSFSGVACTDDKIAAYFATGALPARVSGNRSDVQCDPVPQPDPTATTALQRSASPETTKAMDMKAVLDQLHTSAR